MQSSFAAPAAAADVEQLLQLPFPPVQPLIGCEAGSFAQDTITTRLPAIMGTVLADLALQVCGRGGRGGCLSAPTFDAWGGGQW